MVKVLDMPLEDRPREKLLAKDAAALSDEELLAVFLGKGTKKMPVLMLSRQVLKLLDQVGPNPGLDALQSIPGIGPARAAQISAVLEFTRRRYQPTGYRIRNALDLLPLIRHYAGRKQEYFLCTSLNGANEVITTRVVSIGSVNQGQAFPREVFAGPITDRAAGVVVAHNHPSGHVRPSNADKNVTRQLYRVGELLRIPLLDHLIFTHKDHFSFYKYNFFMD